MTLKRPSTRAWPRSFLQQLGYGVPTYIHSLCGGLHSVENFHRWHSFRGAYFRYHPWDGVPGVVHPTGILFPKCLTFGGKARLRQDRDTGRRGSMRTPGESHHLRDELVTLIDVSRNATPGIARRFSYQIVNNINAGIYCDFKGFLLYFSYCR